MLHPQITDRIDDAIAKWAEIADPTSEMAETVAKIRAFAPDRLVHIDDRHIIARFIHHVKSQ